MRASAARADTEPARWVDPRDTGSLPDVYLAMGETAENVAALKNVSRRRQDEFGARSQQLAQAAISSGFFGVDITPIELPDGTVISADDGPRPNVTADSLAALKPAFRPGGTVTAGNCCPVNDGAAALIVMSDARAAELGVPPLARIVSTGVSAVSPEIMGLGPVEASRRALANAGMSVRDLDMVEINEAFAAQVLPCVEDLKIDPEKVNVHGGAIALGHPFGQTGARLTTTLINGLRFRDCRVGLVTMCAAGGQGMAMVIERLS
jgi:acetyl-CoA C-acetyltransferase